jgi:hypothetical protein
MSSADNGHEFDNVEESPTALAPTAEVRSTIVADRRTEDYPPVASKELSWQHLA